MTVPFGSWPSPISADLVAAGSVGLGGPALRTGEDGRSEVWWSEQRPSEGGRVVLVRRREGERAQDQLIAPFSARTRVHEYGGGAWFLGRNAVYFSNGEDQRLYRLDLDGGGRLDPDAGDPQPITPEPSTPHGLRYADGRESPGGDWVVAVREDHTGAEGEPRNELVAIPADGSAEPTVLYRGADFVMAPRVSPDERWLAWVRWNHPDMPWDGTELCVAPLFDGFRLGNVQVVAGCPGQHGVSAISPDWTSDGQLVFSDDRTGWWNLYRWSPTAVEPVAITSLDDSEIGYPPWVFGLQPWTELPGGRLAAIQTRNAQDRLVVVSNDGEIVPLASQYVAISGLASSPGGELVVIGQTTSTTPGIISVAPNGDTFAHRDPDDVGVDAGWYAEPELFEFDSGDGRRSRAFFYPPTAPGLQGPSDERSPLIVIGHGGPTSHATKALSLKIQYWTSRGFAVVDVNYAGSSGHGRLYRRLLDSAWGVADVEDCVAAATALADAGRVDPDRLAIRGGSAGGFTVLAALAQTDVFDAGTSLYGVSDLEALARDTHKFESRYLDRLVGPYPAEQATYLERSPLSLIDGFACPLLVLQGTEDEVVPPNQAEAILAALERNNVAHASIFFEGEQHGFRQAANVIRSLEAELWFYGKVFGFEPADEIDPIDDAVGL